MGSGWSSWKNHVPTRPVAIEAAGRRWSGQWQVDGEDLVLASAYGCRRAPIGDREAGDVARQLMREVLVDFATRRRPSFDC